MPESPFSVEKSDILIVDDMVVNLRILMSALREAGYHVRAVTSGKLAVEAARKKRPDIILLDVFMPEMDGYEVCSALKSDPETAAIPVIFISALADFASRVKGFRCGGVDYIVKPFDLPEVLSRIHTHLSLSLSMKSLGNELSINKLIADFTKRLVRLSDYFDIGELLLETVTELLGCRFALVSSLAGLSNGPEIPMICGVSSGTREYAEVHDAFGKLGELVLKEQSMWVSYGYEHLGGHASLGYGPLKRFVLMPAVIEGVAIGVVIIAEPKKEMTGRSIDILGQLSHLYALALDRSRLHQKKLRTALKAFKREKTERLKYEGLAKRAFSDLEQIFERTKSGMQVVTLDAEIIQMNNAMEEILGQSRGECVGKRCHEVFHTSNCISKKCPLHLFSMGAKSFQETEVVVKQGNARSVDCKLNAFPLFDDEGEVVAIVEEYRDITERKRLESIAMAVNTMNNVGYVFSGIRHELGNPVNALKMTLSVLEDKIDNLPLEDIKEFLHRSLGDIGRLEYLLKSLKSFSMYDSIVLQKVKLSEFFRDFLALAQTDIEQKGISLELIRCEHDCYINVDPRLLQQVMLNLCSNSIDALAEVEAPRIRIYSSIDDKSSLVHLFFEDNGIGMTSRQKSELFRPFYTNKKHGTGLGLVLVKKMLSQMNSLIAIESQPERGTVVKLTFAIKGQ